MRTVKQSTTGLHSSTNESHFGNIKILTVGKTEIKKLRVALVDLGHVNSTYAQLKKPKIHGILGSDVLYLYEMIIDYGSMQLIIP